MDWKTVLVFIGVIVLFVLLKRVGQVSAAAAANYLKEGAVVIDVRTPGEFSGGHLQKAINIPLDQIESLAPSRLKDKDQVLLLHCQSGMRSGAAKKKLSLLGYTRAYNLGSYARAARIVQSK